MAIAEYIFPAASAACAAGIGYFLWKWDVIRPGSFAIDPKKQRDVWGVPTPIWLLGAALVLLSQIEGGLLASQAGVSVIGAEGSMQREGMVGIAAYATGILVGVLAVVLIGQRLGSQSGMRVGGRDVGAGVVGILLAAPACIVVSFAGEWVHGWVTGAQTDPVAHDTLRRILENRGSVWAWVVAALAIVGAPIVEEIVYRALLQSCFLCALGRTWPAIIGTSCVFVAMHRVGGAVPWHALPTLFVLSMAMGIAFERTRSLGVPIVMHMLFNAGNVAVAVLTQGAG